jgi:hypothetical protein
LLATLLAKWSSHGQFVLPHFHNGSDSRNFAGRWSFIFTLNTTTKYLKLEEKRGSDSWQKKEGTKPPSTLTTTKK